MAGPRDERGMSLLEVLFATFLLALVIVASVTGLSLTLRQNKQAGLRSTATSLAAERVEDLTSMRFRVASELAEYALPGEAVTTGPPGLLTADYGSIPGYPEFRRVVRLDHDQPSAGLLRIVVDVFWTDLQQGEKSHRLVTFLHPTLQPGL